MVEQGAVVEAGGDVRNITVAEALGGLSDGGNTDSTPTVVVNYGFICPSFWSTRSLSHGPARVYIPIFKFIENFFDLFENSYVLSGSYRVI